MSKNTLPIIISSAIVVIVLVGGGLSYLLLSSSTADQTIVSPTKVDTPTVPATTTQSNVDVPTVPITTTQSNGVQSTVTSSTPTTKSNQCIVTISDKKYDVTSLRVTHPGGDVFVCDTDMTKSYQNQHGSNMRRMQRYLVN
jgi:hypothetical protein